MKKKNLYIEKAYQITEILNKEKKLYLPKLNSLKIEAEKIKQINDKIIFWETEKRKYLSELSIETFATSGVVSIDMPNNTELFLDREITIEINKLKNQLPTQQTETKTEQETVELKPVLKPEVVQIVFDILKDFFSLEHQKEFKNIIETGNNASNKLLFNSNGNRLTDSFKKLIEHNFITGCQKQDLINWIISNFTFTQQNIVKVFIYDTVEKTISRNYYPCKSPLIEIRNGKIEKVELPRKRKQFKY